MVIDSLPRILIYIQCYHY